MGWSPVLTTWTVKCGDPELVQLASGVIGSGIRTAAVPPGAGSRRHGNHGPSKCIPAMDVRAFKAK